MLAKHAMFADTPGLCADLTVGCRVNIMPFIPSTPTVTCQALRCARCLRMCLQCCAHACTAEHMLALLALPSAWTAAALHSAHLCALLTSGDTPLLLTLPQKPQL